MYSAQITKFDRHGYKPRRRTLILTDEVLYVIGDARLKNRIPLKNIIALCVSSLNDGILVIRVPAELKHEKVLAYFFLNKKLFFY